MRATGYRTALVTGASRGIGEAIVRRLLADGLTVTATSRRPEALAALTRETGCAALALDPADRAAVTHALGAADIDVLVLNAAAPGVIAPMHATSPETIDTLLAGNVAGPLALIAACVPGMIARRRGHVVVIGSMAGHATLPGMPIYGMTKAALHTLACQLRLDVHGSGVRVSEIVPGRVRTGIHLDMMPDRTAAQAAFYDGYETLEAEDIAAAVGFVISAPARMDVTLMEILPTDQVVGGAQYHKRGGATSA